MKTLTLSTLTLLSFSTGVMAQEPVIPTVPLMDPPATLVEMPVSLVVPPTTLLNDPAQLPFNFINQALLNLNRVSLVTTRPFSFTNAILGNANAAITLDLARTKWKSTEVSFGIMTSATNANFTKFDFSPQANFMYGSKVLGAGFDTSRNEGFIFMGVRLN